MVVPSRDLDHGQLSSVGARHERRREEREEAEEDRRGEHVVEPGGEDPPPRDEAEHRVVLGEFLKVIARRLSLVDQRACICEILSISERGCTRNSTNIRKESPFKSPS
jgi:hypothetical protein